MGADSKIEWCDHTFNPWIGCTKVSPGCAHCYAEGESKRRGWAQWGKGKERHHTSENYWKQPYRWNEEAKKAGKPARVFCASLADVFDPEVPDEWRKALFDTITDTPHLIWQLLTKRPEVAHDFYHNHIALRDETIIEKFLPNVWLGVSVEDQKRADERIPILLQIPAKIRFLSCEPLLGPVDFSKVWARHGAFVVPNGIHWIIAGGESGHHARPMHPNWARSLRDQCVAAGVSFLFKQWGEWCPRGPESLGYPSVDGVSQIRLTDAGDNGSDLSAEGDNHVWMNRAGKKRAGRLLDGREWNEFPQSGALGDRALPSVPSADVVI